MLCDASLVCKGESPVRQGLIQMDLMCQLSFWKYAGHSSFCFHTNDLGTEHSANLHTQAGVNLIM